MHRSSILLFLLFPAIIIAQRPGQPGGQFSSLPPEGIIKGQVVNALDLKPLEYTNLVLYSYRDSTMVTGGVTGADGTFTLTQIPYGRFFLKIHFIGFNKLTIDDIRITPASKTINLGQIKLEPAAQNLEGFEVVAEKQHIEFQIDKKVVNVSQDLMAQGGTAVNALENVPSVQVDINGNVLLRGSSSFTVLIDGRPSVLKGTEALQQIPASNIDRIEIITNPSAKYDPDGVAGIINVIMKQRTQAGFNGIINLSAGTRNKYSADFLVNFFTGKYNFFVGADYRNHQSGGTRSSRQTTYFTDSTRYQSSEGDRIMKRGGYSFKGGIEYTPTKTSWLSLSGEIGQFNFRRQFTGRQLEFNQPETYRKYSYSDSYGHNERDYYRISLNAQHKFNDEGHQIDALVSWSDNKGRSSNEQTEYKTDSEWNINDPDPYKIKINEPGDGSDFRIKVDYTRPMRNKAKLEAGYQTRLELNKDSYRFTQWNSSINDWVENPLYSNSVDFRNEIHSIYALYSDYIGKFGYKLGLRGEYNYRRIQNAKAQEPSLIDRFDYFPTIHVSHTFTNGDQIQASYTRRVERPSGWSLDPFITYIDPYNRRRGNPDLKPEMTDSYDLSYQKRFKGSLLSLESYYRISNDKITRIRSLQSDGTFLYTFENINRDYTLGVEGMINTTPVKWLELNLSGTVYHYRLEGNLEGTEIDNQTTSWRTRLNTTFRLPKDFRLQLMAFYNGPTITAQGEMKDFFSTSIAFRKEFFNRQLSLSASFSDIFNTSRFETTSSGPGFTSIDRMTHESQVLMVNLSYRINNYQRKSRTSDTNGRGGMDMGGDDF